MDGSLIGGASVAEAVPLAPLTTLRVGPIARRLITCDTTQKVVDVLRALGTEDALVLAGGSNVVLADDLADLTVVLLANTEITVEDDIVRAEAGAAWDDVVVTSLAYGLGGLECLSGIPGSAGATPVQNVGAYGAEVADTIRRVRLLDRRTGEDRWVGPETLQFGYRTSILRHSQAAVVLEVEFALDRDGRSAPLRYGELADALGVNRIRAPTRFAVREAVLGLRARKGMVLDDGDHDTWSVGSFFTNPVVSPAEFEMRQEPRGKGGRARSQLPGVRRCQAGRRLARGAGRLLQGIPRRRRICAPFDQARARCDQSRRGHDRRRDRAGQNGTRWCQNDIRDRSGHPSRF